MQCSVWAKQYIAKDTWCNYQTRMCIIDICTNYKNWLTDFSWECPTDTDWEGEGGGVVLNKLVYRVDSSRGPTPTPYHFKYHFGQKMYFFLYTQLRTLQTVFKIWINYHKTRIFSQPFHIPQNAPASPLGPLQSLNRNDRFPYPFIYFS